jgi:hypothetical protein
MKFSEKHFFLLILFLFIATLFVLSILNYQNTIDSCKELGFDYANANNFCYKRMHFDKYTGVYNFCYMDVEKNVHADIWCKDFINNRHIVNPPVFWVV